MAADRVLRDALDELGRLPDDAWEQTAAYDVLAVLDSCARAFVPADPDEKAILMSSSENFQRFKSEQRAEGRTEGRAEGQRGMLLLMLERRFGPLPAALLERVKAAETTDLERWATALLSAHTVADVFTE